MTFRLLWLIIAAALTLPGPVGFAQGKPIRLARFDIDVTPPVGSAMAYDRVVRVEELGLRCRGIILLGAGEPIAMCAVDWIGIGNEAHDAFCDTIANAVGTTRDRVAVQTLHQHDAPRADFTAESLLHQAGATDLGALEGSFAREVLQRLGTAAKQSLASATTITHAAVGEAKVIDVASNRRIQDESGRVVATRYTTCRDPKIRALPDGTIDPVLSSVSFWSDDEPIAVLSYYACHPQSYYRTGIPSPDFPGIARFMRGQDVPSVLHVHFNGAGGNIGAGKYNDGAKTNRLKLARRIADGMKEAFESSQKFPITAKDLGWFVAPVALPVGQHLKIDELRTKVAEWETKDYWGSPEQLAWALRCKDGHKIDLSCLKVGDVRILHMPGELFVEYQLAAKKLRPKLHVAMAAYGDYGPGYIGTAAAYGQGGYETSERASKVAPEVEEVLMDGIKKLLDDADSVVGNFASELPRVPPTEPADALQTFQVASGYEMQLVASEPLLGSPVAVEWDAKGRMFVCEMRGYSEDQDDNISTIGLLTDDDQDGLYDSRTEYASGLRWPTAIFPFDGGLFVGDAPHIYYMKDTDGDGTADSQTIVLTGFGTSNVQGLMNSMRWGLNNMIHVACSSVGGKIQIVGREHAAVNIHGRDLAFNPRTFEFTPISGAAQHGMCFDDWGRKFASSNSNHIMQVMYEDHHVARNRFLRAPPARVSIAADGPQAEVFRTSPVEPWRIVRTRLRVSGVVGGPIEGGGRAAGYFTGATGITIYRGDAWPASNRGYAIVGDVGSNLIHRKRLSNQGMQFTAKRIDPQSEFVTSTDIWFRPSQFANAPDGSLHVIDTCREVIEHPKSLPPDIKKHLDLTAGRDRGRIYRIVPSGHRFRPAPNLANASTVDCVTMLGHANAWHRETASRLIFERQDRSVVGELEKFLVDSDQPLGRMHALYALSGLNSLGPEMLQIASKDAHPQVRRHAIRLAERLGYVSDLEEELLRLSRDESQEVRVQLAFALGGIDCCERNEMLAKIVKADDANKWTQVAAQSSVADSAIGLFVRLSQDQDFRSPRAGQFLAKLASQISQQNLLTDLRSAISVFDKVSADDAAFALPIVGQLLSGRGKKNSVLNDLSNRGELSELDNAVAAMLRAAIDQATDRNEEESHRVAAIQSLVFGSFADVGDSLSELIDNQQSHEIQTAAMTTLGHFSDARIGPILVDFWPSLSPRLRSMASEILFSRTESTLDWFDAVDRGVVSANDLSIDRLLLLRKSKETAVAQRATQLFKSRAVGRRSDVVRAYKDALSLSGNVQRGREVFKKSCSACHKVEGVGHELGPNLATIKTRGPESILVNVLDPSREVNPEYLNYLVLSNDGKVITGMISAEGANSVTLRRGEGVTETVLRSDIDELQSTGVSIMPEGLEETISKQAMADLIAYLMQAG